MDIPGRLNEAVALHQEGRGDRAEVLYREVLAEAPGHPDALHLLGLLLHQRGDHAGCVEHIGRALGASPENPVFLFNLAVAQAESGQKGEAAATYRRLLERDPRHAQARFNLGNLYRDLEDAGAAEECYREALRVKPDYVKARLNLGTLLQALGRLDEAEAEFGTGREQAPRSAGPYFRLGGLRRIRGRFPEAIDAYGRALEFDPKLVKAHNNIGNIHQDLGDLEKARSAYSRAVRTQPDYLVARFNLANLRQLDGDIDGAISEYRSILAADPDHAEARLNLGHALKRKGLAAEAIAEFRRVLEDRPENGQALAALVHQLQYACEWAEMDRLLPRLDARTDQCLREGAVPGESPFENLTRHEDPARNLAVARMHAARIEQVAAGMMPPFTHGPSEKDGPVVVGYLSHDFQDHPVGHLVQGLFGAHDRDRLRVHVYSHGPDDGSPYRRRIQRDADRFLDIRNLSHPEAARAIRADGVDILVDLMGHTLHSRLEIFALRPAPIQIAFLGYPGTTGAAFMDYILADRVVLPPEHAGFFTERPIYLPHTYQANETFGPVGSPPDRAAAGLPETGFVFCSFNQSYKITAALFDRWASILRRVPGAVLWLLRCNASAEANLRRAAEDRGLDPARLVFADRVGKAEHLARQQLADLALDPFPVNGHTTTSDILRSGVPAVAVKGGHFASRVAAGLLSAAGLPELAAADPEAYEETAVRLATHPDELRAIRAKLAENRKVCPLFDTTRFARNLERAFLSVRDDRAAGRSARPLEITDGDGPAIPLDLPSATIRPVDSGGEGASSAAKLLAEARARQAAGDAEGALAGYERVLALQPDSIAAHGNMGAVLHGLGRLEEAESRYRRVLEIKPDSHEAWNNLGNVHESRGDSAEAIRCYQKAVEIAPGFAEGFNNLGLAYKSSGKNEKAMEAYEKAVAVQPDMDRAYNGVIYLYQQFCMWEKAGETGAALDRLTEKALAEGRRPAESPFTSLTRTGDPERNFAVAASWSREVARRMKGAGRSFDLSARNVSREKLTVGYLSNDFYNHATAHLMLGLFGRHDRNRFRIHCYSYGKKDASVYGRRIREDCDRFVDIAALSHEAAAQRIYEDEVDILVELKGYTKDNRLEITALRPAPIQIEWLGFPCTTGAEFIDYVVTDRIITPEAHLPFYSEQPIYMPHAYQINDDRQPIAHRAFSREEFDLPEDAFVFCSFNQVYKLTPEVFDIWMRLLGAVPGSVLWLLPRSKAAETRLREAAEARGVSGERIVCCGPMPKDAHLARHRLADLGLDTFIVNGHTTTSDALWAGLPVVTLTGPHFASRVSASLLRAAGLPELVADNLAGYEALALRLARDPDALAAVRARLLENRGTHPLFDTARFARNLEQGFEAAWRRFRENRPPEPIEVRDEAGPRPFDALPLPDIQEVRLVPGEVSAFAAAGPVVEMAVPPPANAGWANAPAAEPPDPVPDGFSPLDSPPAAEPGSVEDLSPRAAEPATIPGFSSPAADPPDSGEGAGEERAPLEEGRTRLARGEWEAAMGAFQKAAEAGIRQAADAYAGLARAWLGKGRPESAVFFAQRAWAVHPAHAEAFEIQALAFHRLGNAAAARTAMARVAALDPERRAGLELILDNAPARPTGGPDSDSEALKGGPVPVADSSGAVAPPQSDRAEEPSPAAPEPTAVELNLPAALKRAV
ncbi:MAG: tetratricopeptide repeat protein, partial [Thermodesulfobacteriota bacterium]